jgi:hypothetical protein
MDADELFLLTLEDLEQRVQLGRGEYDALMSALLLRKVLLDDHPLLHQVNRSRQLRVRFRLRDLTPPEGSQNIWSPGESLSPDVQAPSSAATVDLTLDQFLARPVFVAFGQEVSVRELIKFMANNEGAVHMTRPDKPKAQALWDARWAHMRTGPDGMYGGLVHELIAVGRIALDGLNELRERIRTETWPPGMPAAARGLRRPSPR